MQLAHTLPADSLFRNYWYRSNINGTMVRHLNEIAIEAKNFFPEADERIVLDIGCNDGSLLGNFDSTKWMHVGFEPSDVGSLNYGFLVRDYFSAEKYQELIHEPADLIFSIAMLYDLDQPCEFVAGISKILAEGGLWICEFNYLVDMVAGTWDQVVHEHLTYWSLTTFELLVKEYGLEIINVHRSSTNGGSIRCWVSQRGKHRVLPSVTELLQLERDNLESGILAFPEKVAASQRAAETWMSDHKNAIVWGYGASTRGLTSLHALGITERIGAVAERNPLKVDRLYGATGIPIVSEEFAEQTKPDYLLALPYSFIDEFKEREPWATFLRPLPLFGEVSGG